eukprot:6994029-Pyramimonas_sp.AAC.1
MALQEALQPGQADNARYHLQARKADEETLIIKLDEAVDSVRVQVKEDLKITEEMSRRQSAMLAAEVPKITVRLPKRKAVTQALRSIERGCGPHPQKDSPYAQLVEIREEMEEAMLQQMEEQFTHLFNELAVRTVSRPTRIRHSGHYQTVLILLNNYCARHACVQYNPIGGRHGVYLTREHAWLWKSVHYKWLSGEAYTITFGIFRTPGQRISLTCSAYHRTYEKLVNDPCSRRRCPTQQCIHPKYIVAGHWAVVALQVEKRIRQKAEETLLTVMEGVTAKYTLLTGISEA